MPITTYRSDNTTFFTDEDFKKCLPQGFYIERLLIPQLWFGLFWRKPKVRYQLLYDYANGEKAPIINSVEYQIINFPPDDEEPDWSINNWVTKQVILTYFLRGEKVKTQEVK
jgi:hypothetical protein